MHRTKEHSFKPFNANVPVTVQPSNTADKVWAGKTIASSLLYEKANDAGTGKIEVYCVDCGINGAIQFDSIVTFTPADLLLGRGLRAGTV